MSFYVLRCSLWTPQGTLAELVVYISGPSRWIGSHALPVFPE